MQLESSGRANLHTNPALSTNAKCYPQRQIGAVTVAVHTANILCAATVQMPAPHLSLSANAHGPSGYHRINVVRKRSCDRRLITNNINACTCTCTYHDRLAVNGVPWNQPCHVKSSSFSKYLQPINYRWSSPQTQRSRRVRSTDGVTRHALPVKLELQQRAALATNSCCSRPTSLLRNSYWIPFL